jgi:AhpD family alkylhydroperoxidase
MAKKTKTSELPQVLEEFAAQYPQLWDAYNALGEAATNAGPLDEKTQRLIKLAIAIGAERRGAVHSHAKRALKAGATPEELTHVGILGITTIGWSGAFAAITWTQETVAQQAKKSKGNKKK